MFHHVISSQYYAILDTEDYSISTDVIQMMYVNAKILYLCCCMLPGTCGRMRLLQFLDLLELPVPLYAAGVAGTHNLLCLSHKISILCTPYLHLASILCV